MAPRPWRPADELDGALERGDLRYSLALAEELRIEDKPIGLETALRLAALVARERPEQYDRFAARWLVRWLDETDRPSIELAAELAASLADLPAEPGAYDVIASMARQS